MALSNERLTGAEGQTVVADARASPASGVPAQGVAAMILIK